MKRIGTIIIFILIILFSFIVYNFIQYRHKNAVSDAAFVRSDTLTNLSFKVGGKIVQMLKKEGDAVQKGEAVARLDSSDFVLAKKELLAKKEGLLKQIAAKNVQKEELAKSVELKILQSRLAKEHLIYKIDALKKQIEAKKAKLVKLKKDLVRYQTLFKQHLIAKSMLEEANTGFKMLKSEIMALQSSLMASKEGLKSADVAIQEAKNTQKKVKELDLLIQGLQKERQALDAKIKEIEQKIDYCTLKAPYSGRIAKRFANIGEVVDKGTPIYALVDPKRLHIEVLLSEKKLKGVKVGNKVSIKIDAYEDREYHGKVQKILPASAATFALVPRDIASGEFTKLDQRFIVRISIDNPTPDLKVGMGASVAIARD